MRINIELLAGEKQDHKHDNVVFATATVILQTGLTGKYLKMAIDTIADADFVEYSWDATEDDGDPGEIVL